MRILIVEDEADLLRTLAKVLRGEGYAVDTAADGGDAVYKACAFVWDAAATKMAGQLVSAK